MDVPLETTEIFKELSIEAYQQSRDWTPISENWVYECKRTNAHTKLINQFVKDHVCAYSTAKSTRG
jgi:hypothetical protein